MAWWIWMLIGYTIATYMWQKRVRRGVNLAIVWTIAKFENLLRRTDDND